MILPDLTSAETQSPVQPPPHDRASPPARPAPSRLRLPAANSFGNAKSLRVDYTPRAKWIGGDGRTGKVAYELPGMGAIGAVGLHPATHASFEPSAPAPVTGLFSGAPDVTVGASVTRPF